jgi:hypothetical protein
MRNHAATLIIPTTVLLAVALLAACETPKPSVRTNTGPSANLASYHTYTFAASLGTNRGG